MYFVFVIVKNPASEPGRENKIICGGSMQFGFIVINFSIAEPQNDNRKIKLRKI